MRCLSFHASGWSTVVIWVSLVLWSSVQSMCFWREWQSSARLVLVFNAVSNIHSSIPPRRWADVEWSHLMSGNQGVGVLNDIKPRTWPIGYEDIPRASGGLSVPTSRIRPSSNETFHRIPTFPKDCVPRSPWHYYVFTNCNLFHEISMASGLAATISEQGTVSEDLRVAYGFAGATRESWFLESSICANGEHRCNGRTILRTLRWRELHDEQILDKQRVDAVVSERLTSSPHVIDIYGFCGGSALNEFADGGMFTRTFRHKYYDNERYTDRELLTFAQDAALAVADLHDIDGQGAITSFVHHDLRAENFLTVNGKLKISDFNNGQLLRWDFEKNERCYGFDWSGGCGKSREQTNRKAPEECREEKDRMLTTEKVEVYRFGAFFFFLISKGDWVYSFERSSNGTLHRPEPSTVKELILSEKKPSLPPYVKESNSTEIKAIVRAMRMAHTFDPRKRPSARDIANYLVRASAKRR